MHYRVVVTRSGGSVTSSVVNLIVAAVQSIEVFLDDLRNKIKVFEQQLSALDD